MTAHCTCGHDQATHWHDRGQCMHSTETETWACVLSRTTSCPGYVPGQHRFGGLAK